MLSKAGAAKTFPHSGHFSIFVRPASIITTAANTIRTRGRKSIHEVEVPEDAMMLVPRNWELRLADEDKETFINE